MTPTQDLQREVKSASPWLTERVGYGGTPAARFDYLKTLAALPLATATPIAHAHGEEVLVSLGLVLLSFLACVLAIRVVKPLRPYRFAAVAGALVGLAVFAWPFGSFPYRGNETLICALGLLAPPAFMFASVVAAVWLRRRPVP